jgi:hypothetical protein
MTSSMPFDPLATLVLDLIYRLLNVRVFMREAIVNLLKGLRTFLGCAWINKPDISHPSIEQILGKKEIQS